MKIVCRHFIGPEHCLVEQLMSIVAAQLEQLE